MGVLLFRVMYNSAGGFDRYVDSDRKMQKNEAEPFVLETAQQYSLQMHI